jgi:hypothetical protein
MRSLTKYPLYLAALYASCCMLAGAEKSYQELSDKSPFLPPGYGKNEEVAAPPVVQNGPLSRELEFRGVMKMQGRYQFSIYNKKGQQSYWIKENQTEDGITCRDYNPDTKSVTIVQNGRSERIQLVAVTDSPLPVSSSQPAATTNSAPQGNLAAPPSQDNSERRRVIPRRRVILPRQ